MHQPSWSTAYPVSNMPHGANKQTNTTPHTGCLVVLNTPSRTHELCLSVCLCSVLESPCRAQKQPYPAYFIVWGFPMLLAQSKEE